MKTPTCSIDALMPGREAGINAASHVQHCRFHYTGETLATPKSAWSDSNARPLGSNRVRCQAALQPPKYENGCTVAVTITVELVGTR